MPTPPAGDKVCRSSRTRTRRWRRLSRKPPCASRGGADQGAGPPEGRSVVLVILSAPHSSSGDVGGARWLVAAETAAAAVAQDQPSARAQLERFERHLTAGAAHAAHVVVGEQVDVVDHVRRHDKRADVRRHAVLDGLHAHGAQHDQRKPHPLLRLQARQLALSVHERDPLLAHERFRCTSQLAECCCTATGRFREGVGRSRPELHRTGIC
eukprot:946537-Prymnesium_polylepis.1